MELIKKTLNNKFLISIYVGLLAAFFSSYALSIGLSKESNFLIGEATAYGIDINARIKFVYTLIAIGFVAAILTSYALSKFGTHFLSKIDSQPSHLILFLTLIFACVSMPNPFDSTTFCFLNIILIAVWSLSILGFHLEENEIQHRLASHLIVLINVFVLFQNWIIVLLLLGIQILIIFKKVESPKVNLVHLLIGSLPIAITLGVELTMILNQRNIYLTNYWLPISLFVFVFALWFLVRKSHLKSELHQFYKIQLPLLIVSLASLMFYAPIQSWNSEMFEMANELNPVMLTAVYNKLPVLDFVSSHLFSDFSAQMVYVFLNGYNNTQDPTIYKWIPMIFSMLVSYYFLKSVVGEKLFVGAFILFLPFTTLFFPSVFGFVLIPILLIKKFIESSKTKFLWFSFVSVVLLGFWRVDLAVGIISSFVFVLPFLFFLKKEFRKSLIVFVSLGLIIGGFILFLMNKMRPNLLQEMAHYFGAGQAHGIHTLTHNESSLFYLDFYILPIIIVSILVALIANRKNWISDSFYFPMLLLIGFYLFNLQRGLVRHSFVENVETIILSFSWLIVLIFIHRFLAYRKLSLFFGGALLVGFFASINPSINWNSLLDADKKFSLTNLPELNETKIIRTIDKPTTDHDELVAFLKSNLSEKETFIDFSNTPMLYYYTQKEVPSLFCQYLQNTVDGFLQEKNLNLLRQKSLPYVVFNHVPRGFFDVSDGIPNEVRYYRITEFIYKNYKPFKTIGSFAVWIKKTKKVQSELNLSNEIDRWYLGRIPYFWKAEKQQKGFKFSRTVSCKKEKNQLTNIKPGDFLQLTIQSIKDDNLILRGFSQDSLKFECHMFLGKGTNKYLVPIGASYNAITHDSLSLNFETANFVKIRKLDIGKLH